jgi:hypothetical protein
VPIDLFEQSLRLSHAAAESGPIRLDLAQRYSYVFPDTHLVNALCGLGPLVEMGAGTGYWTRELRVRGADVLAFDQAPPDGDTPNRYHGRTPTWTQVLQGDQTVLTEHADRALFLCWPPLFSSLGDCLHFYEGNTVACIGDGGHRTTRLRNLEAMFEIESVHPARALDPAPDHAATLGIWRRIAPHGTGRVASSA